MTRARALAAGWVRATCIVAAAVCASAAAAQTGGISVVVTDAAGRPLPGAAVTISHETGFVKTTTELTDVDGVVAFPVLRPGSGYVIEVAVSGHATVRRDGLRVRVDDNQVLPVQLIGEFQERVKVTARAEVLDVTTARQSTRFSEDFISDLPVPGRFYQNVLTLAPGVQDADGDGNPNVHGSRSRDFQAIVSGVPNVDPLTGRWMSRVNPNSIEELEVITAGAGVEFGRAQGGFARIIQKQGSNRHEGVAEFYYRTSKLDGDGAGDNSSEPDPKFDWYQPSLQLSGPLLRDRVWYRASVEYRDIEEPVNVTTGIQITTLEDRTNDFQVTWQVSPRNKLGLQYLHDPRRVTNLGISSLVGAGSSFGFDRETQTTTLSWIAPVSPKILVESTLGWQDQNLEVFPTTTGRLNDCVAGKAFLQNARCFNNQTGQVSGSYNEDLDDHRQRLSIKGKATLYGSKLWGLSHRLKLGWQTENERYFRRLVQRPEMSYFIVGETVDDPTGQGGTELEPFGLAVVSLAVPQTDDVRANGTNWAFYVEDQFRPVRNLTVTLGARVDREEIRSEGHELMDPERQLDDYRTRIAPYLDPASDLYPITFETAAPAAMSSFIGYEDFPSLQSQILGLVCDEGDTKCRHDLSLSVESLARRQLLLDNKRRQEDIDLVNTNVSPYLSLAWDPRGNSKTLIKMAGGRHYNNIPLIVPLQELQPAGATLLYLVDLAGEELGRVRLQNALAPGLDVTMLDPDLSTPYQDELTFSVERELWVETSLRLSYINRRYRDQLQDRNVNVATGDYGRCALQDDPTRPALVESWGSNFQLVDPHTLQPYVDTEPGPGDGRVDDCIGRIVDFRQSTAGGASGVGTVQRPDGLLDLYKQNPFWGDIFVIGNFNRIDYEAWVLELVRRQYRNWELQGSYTWSRAEGDGEDFSQGFDNDPSISDDIFGFQSYDQRHVVKLNATTVTPWGVRLGTALNWQSGLPYSILHRQPAFDALPPATSAIGLIGVRSRDTYPTGVRNDQRNVSSWNVDLRISKELTLRRGSHLQLGAEVYNVFNEGTYQVYNPDFDRGVQVNGVNESRNVFGRRWQLGIKLAF